MANDYDAVSRILPSVLAASCDELLAAGWGSVPREDIPADWRTRKPYLTPQQIKQRKAAAQRDYNRRNREKINAKARAKARAAGMKPRKMSELCKARRCCGCRRIVKGTLCHCGHPGCEQCAPYRLAKRL